MKIAIFWGLILDFGRPWGGIGGGRGATGWSWDFFGSLWRFLGASGGLARGVLETQKGLFFHKYAYLIDAFITFSRGVECTLMMHLSNVTTENQYRRRVSEKWKKSYTTLASRKCYHNKSVYPCASVVATVVRIPRSEVSERHRAGSWVWVVAKTRLEIW